MEKIREIMEDLDEAIVHLKVDKCKTACKNIEWLGNE